MKPFLLILLSAQLVCAYGEATLSPLCKGCRKIPDMLKELRINKQNEILPEADLLLKLDKEGRLAFKSLDADGQELARRLAATDYPDNYSKAISMAKWERERLSQIIPN